MFGAIASLILFGTLSPLSVLLKAEEGGLLAVTPPAISSRLKISSSFSASGAIVVDMLTGKELFAVDADAPRQMASLAKLMTVIIILEKHDLSEIVTVPRSVLEVSGNVIGLQPGDRYTIRDLLAASLVASANDAAHVLAIEHSDSLELFAEEMNARALALGLSKTSFTNPVGFDSPGQLSTPRELAWLSMYALKNDFIRSLASRGSVTIHDQVGGEQIVLYNTNRLISSHPAQFFGLKTGTTDAAGECLISLTYNHGRPYLFVILKSSDRYEDTLQLFDSLSQLSS